MIDGGDALYEALKNALESDATCIRISVREWGDSCDCLISDDGRGFVGNGNRFFACGVSGKTLGRGRGLALIDKVSGGNCHLERNGGLTTLHFTLPKKDRVHLEDVVPALFALPDGNVQLVFSYDKDGEEHLLDGKELRKRLGDVRQVGNRVAIKQMVIAWEKEQGA